MPLSRPPLALQVLDRGSVSGIAEALMGPASQLLLPSTLCHHPVELGARYPYLLLLSPGPSSFGNFFLPPWPWVLPTVP